MATETESHKQTLFFVVLGQKYTTHKVWAKSETMRAGPLFRYFGVYMELLLIGWLIVSGSLTDLSTKWLSD